MEEPNKNAVTIQIQSWATPLIGLLMLLCGLAIGFLGRPLLMPTDNAGPATASASAASSEKSPTSPAATAAAISNPGATQNAVQPASTPLPASVAATQEATIAKIIAQTKHFKGDPNAKVTILEFSDFQ